VLDDLLPNTQTLKQVAQVVDTQGGALRIPGLGSVRSIVNMLVRPFNTPDLSYAISQL
jgi:hypothetical protein